MCSSSTSTTITTCSGFNSAALDTNQHGKHQINTILHTAGRHDSLQLYVKCKSRVHCNSDYHTAGGRMPAWGSKGSRVRMLCPKKRSVAHPHRTTFPPTLTEF
ncbi:hypothetical protein E2C01_040877 [Portunus trituberculatus]|uniref:Uncharacterized protein n=1 Tax=Portunus trituberculatus TaxID=210409 RepID=A0A5B7FPY2_PORTR|nr:hypothetical protein [Portunus trituberculatus]